MADATHVKHIEPPRRWAAVITYRTDGGPLDVPHDVEELFEIHDLVERGPDWNSIIAIRVTLARSTGEVTLEAASHG